VSRHHIIRDRTVARPGTIKRRRTYRALIVAAYYSVLSIRSITETTGWEETYVESSIFVPTRVVFSAYRFPERFRFEYIGLESSYGVRFSGLVPYVVQRRYRTTVPGLFDTTRRIRTIIHTRSPEDSAAERFTFNIVASPCLGNESRQRIPLNAQNAVRSFAAGQHFQWSTI